MAGACEYDTSVCCHYENIVECRRFNGIDCQYVLDVYCHYENYVEYQQSIDWVATMFYVFVVTI